MAGMSAIECIEACLKMNLNCKIDKNSDIKGVCVSQSVASGMTVKAGDIIYVKLSSSGTATYGQQNEQTKSSSVVDSSGEDGTTAANTNKRREE